ncbi:hypothetical protein AB0G35_20430 [Streptomyces sp. NPDC021749]|uniref:hypothetical protein n=1 Tax=Streptomyces sp. NPDC021749 TaxID=3154905 RepID=UPI0033F36A95
MSGPERSGVQTASGSEGPRIPAVQVHERFPAVQIHERSDAAIAIAIATAIAVAVAVAAVALRHFSRPPAQAGERPGVQDV